MYVCMCVCVYVCMFVFLYVLFCIVSYGLVLYCIVSHGMVWYCIVLHCIVLYCMCVCLHMCIYVHIYICICICIYYTSTSISTFLGLYTRWALGRGLGAGTWPPESSWTPTFRPARAGGPAASTPGACGTCACRQAAFGIDVISYSRGPRGRISGT